MFKKFISNFLKKASVVRTSINLNDRQGAIHRAWGHVFTNHLEGDYVEFGVYKGDSLITSYNEYLNIRKWLHGQTTSQEEWRRTLALEYSKVRTRFHGLDTFGGMPDNKENNNTYGTGTFISDLDDVRKKCEMAGVKDFFLYKGLFKDSAFELNEKISRKVAIVNFDGDLYASAKDSLDIIEPYLQIGTVLLFDDYNAFCADNTKGERKAWLEFRDRSTLIYEKWFSYQYVGQAYLCVGEKANNQLFRVM